LRRRKHKFSHLRDHLSDTNTASFVIVLAAERLPILETIELNEQLSRAGIEVECMVVNKRAPRGMGEFLDGRHKQEEQHLKLLDQRLGSIRRQDLYLQHKDVLGLEGLKALALSL
jgi:arsenite-transporting ATPase